MAKTFKIQMDDGKGTAIQPVRVEQGVGDQKSAVRVLVPKGARIEVLQERKDNSVSAPDQVRAQRKGKNLQLWFDGSQSPDVVLEGFYDDPKTMPTLVGTAENGNLYDYVPQAPDVNSLPAALQEGNAPVAMALGGAPLPAAFELAGLPLVAAAGSGISGWAIAGGAVAAGAAAGGGGGGGGAPVVPPSGQTGGITPNAANDTGVSATDGVTKNNAPEMTIKAESGAKVVVRVNGKDYTATETSTPGEYKVQLDALPDGVYTPAITVTNSAGSSTVNGTAFTVDTSGATNQPGAVPDPNADAAVTLQVSGISDDTGTTTNDFVTSDTTVVVRGTVSAFSNAGNASGDRLLVQIINSANQVVSEQEVTPSNTGAWEMPTPTSALPEGTYTIKALVVDAAGNEVKAATHALTIAAASLTAVADTAAVTEDASTLTLTGNLIQGTGGSGSDVASHVSYANLHIDQVKAGNSAFQNVSGTEATVSGNYGTLIVNDDGSYTYTLNNLAGNVQALRDGQHAQDVFTYVLTDNRGQTSQTTLSIDITGKNDVPTFSGNTTKTVGQTGSALLADTLTIADVDAGQNQLKDVGSNGLTLQGHFGLFEIHQTATPGAYGWSYTKPNSDLGTHTAIRHDLFTVLSNDGTQSQTFDVTVSPAVGSNLTAQEFHASSVTSLKLTGLVGFSDALVLHGAGPFDLALASKTSLERVDLTDGAAQSINLNLADFMQADTVTIGQAAIHRFFVDGTALDSVLFTGPSVAQSQNAAHQVAGYAVYQIDATHDLLISTAMTSGVSFTG